MCETNKKPKQTNKKTDNQEGKKKTIEIDPHMIPIFMINMYIVTIL